MILTDLTDRVWTHGGDRVAVRDDHREVSFPKLLEVSNAISRQLHSLVKRPGEGIGLLLPNSAAYVASFFAVAREGGVVAPLDTRLQIPELRRYVGCLNAAAVITQDRWVHAVLEAVRDLDAVPAVLAVGRDLTVAVVARGHGPAPTALSGVASPPLVQLFTSGSTGAPKRVVRSHAAIVEEIGALREVLAVDPDDRFIGVAPFCHINGLVRTMLHAMLLGASLYPVEEFSRRRVLGILARERITVFGAVPSVFVPLTRTGDDGHAFDTVRLLFSSSAPLLVEDNRRFQQRWRRLIAQLYGSTETGTISVNLGDDVEQCPGSVGRPLAAVRVSVLGRGGRSAAPREEGELSIASPWAACSYFDDAEATAQSFRDGWYRSGDLGWVDEAGRITLTGRTKLLINRGGFKVNPHEIETVLSRHPKVKEAAVFGAPGLHADEEVCCIIVPREKCTEEEIIHYCQEQLANYKIPRHIEFRAELPKAPTGKVLRAGLGRCRWTQPLRIKTSAEPKPRPGDSELGFGEIFTDHMFLANFHRDKGWCDPRIEPYGLLPLDPAAAVLHYCQAIFEGIKAFRGVDGRIRLFRPKKHAERMLESARRMCIPALEPDFVLESVRSLVALDRDWVPSSIGTSLYIRPTVIADEPFLGVRPARSYLYYVIMSPVGTYYAEGLAPVSILVADQYVRAVEGGIGGAKTGGNYAASLYASEEAKHKGFTQVLWLDGRQQKYLDEVGTMNIMVRIGDEVVTPPLTGTILPGVTRDTVLTLLQEWNVPVTERPISIDEVLEAYRAKTLVEVFGTGTAAVISPVGELVHRTEHMVIGERKIGRLAQRLYDAITDVQYGKVGDTHCWTVVVD